MQEVATCISTQAGITTNLRETASDLNYSAVQLNGLVSKFKLRENK